MSGADKHPPFFLQPPQRYRPPIKQINRLPSPSASSSAAGTRTPLHSGADELHLSASSYSPQACDLAERSYIALAPRFPPQPPATQADRTVSGADLLQPSTSSYSPHIGLAERSIIASAPLLPPQPPATQANRKAPPGTDFAELSNEASFDLFLAGTSRLSHVHTLLPVICPLSSHLAAQWAVPIIFMGGADHSLLSSSSPNRDIDDRSNAAQDPPLPSQAQAPPWAVLIILMTSADRLHPSSSSPNRQIADRSNDAQAPPLPPQVPAPAEQSK
ncbi:hypothetical protein PGTUg99_031452 [Puccinia graminis f. sp. tritici]|uniref:Uncharacterized protein n=1 Tax=Puccinia graminis f. sp. tritici TaxID=56615 RepID=A0A5B0N2F1_PUCGR|nr:hypothetical protein PGTUg99_031452 [Puccinia graminis f. sp. tritici]